MLKHKQQLSKMYPYILCFCGRSLGSLWPLYEAMMDDERAKFHASRTHTVDPNVLSFSNDTAVEPEKGGVLDTLRLTTQCCRTRMMTQVPFAQV